MAIFFAIVLFALPAWLKWAEPRYKVFQVLSPVIVCYATGMLLRNLGFFQLDASLAKPISEAAIPLATALLLLSSNFLAWRKFGKKPLLSFLFCAISVSTAVLLCTQFWPVPLEHQNEMGAMMIGVYTGGTANLAAIGKALNTPDALFTMLNGFDTVVCSIYLLFVLTIGRPVLHLFLPRFSQAEVQEEAAHDTEKRDWTSAMKAWVIGIICVGIGVAFAEGFTLSDANYGLAVIIIATSLAILLSFIPQVRQLKESYFLGDYFILVACLGFGMATDFAEVLAASGEVFAFVAVVVGISIALHFLLAAFARIDADTVIVTSIAAIFGPAFVGFISSRLKNPALLAPGVAMGLLGYAVANYLGLAMAWVLKSIF